MVTIDFDSGTEAFVPVGGYEEEGYKLAPSLTDSAGISNQNAVNGLTSTTTSNKVLFFGISNSTVTLTKLGLAPSFDLLKLNVGYLELGYPSLTPAGVTAVGTLSGGGGVVSRTFSSIPGGLNEFDLAGFGFTNLSSVVFSTTLPGNVVALDDIQVQPFAAPAAVPEPTSAAFLGLGSLALVVRRLRRRTSVVA
ncbi:MAG: PEP-CTERM sorting domain-containing protein [Proteobacteria bacterium]|nr:PEP-CTERM sorting domain-containing protein [Pseudomonadota bacterium]